MEMIGRTRILCIASVGLSVSPAFGGFISISQLSPFNDGQRTPRISGLAFDGQQNPWIIDGLSWSMERLNALNGSVLETYSPQPDPQYNDSLAWSAQTGLFYTANQFYLYSMGLGSRAIIGPFPLFNFTSLAFDPGGNLWVGVDHNTSAELWRVNTSTAQLSFVTSIGVGTQLTALSIDSQGRFYIAAYDSSANTSSIYSVNPNTGTALWLTTALVGSNSDPNLVVDFEQQPGTGRWLAVTEQRSGSGDSFSFGEITGIASDNVPEPSYLAPVGLGLLFIIFRTRRYLASRAGSSKCRA